MNNKLFLTDFSFEESEIVVTPVNFDLTCSYGLGTAKGPNSLIKESVQIDNHFLNRKHNSVEEPAKFFLNKGEIINEIAKANSSLRKSVNLYWDMVDETSKGVEETDQIKERKKFIINSVNQLQSNIFTITNLITENVLENNKIPCIIGGDHSIIEGALFAIDEQYKDNYNILQIDAHCDLRIGGYEGFEKSHASIMANILSNNINVKSLVQVGIRDFSKNEYNLTSITPRQEFTNKYSPTPIYKFLDEYIAEADYSFNGGGYLHNIVEKIASVFNVNKCKNIYLTLDVDGLIPSLCSNTGTPVPGGLDFNKVLFLIKKLKEWGFNFIGFDIVEIGNDKFDGNVASRLLHQIGNIITKY
jgi:agmatinase